MGHVRAARLAWSAFGRTFVIAVMATVWLREGATS
jgi:hypothetical protein